LIGATDLARIEAQEMDHTEIDAWLNTRLTRNATEHFSSSLQNECHALDVAVGDPWSTTSDLDRLPSSGFAALLEDLMKKADQGDRDAILSLGWFARRCVVPRSEDQPNGYQQSQLQDARLLPPADAAWITSFLNVGAP
jgi:hypothetical protein